MSKKRPPNNWKERDVEFFEISDSGIIRELSRGLSEAEVLNYFNVEKDDLGEKDTFFFETEYKRGNLLARRDAVNRLFSSMSDRNGHVPALEYLTRFAEKWPEQEGVANTSRTFKLQID